MASQLCLRKFLRKLWCLGRSVMSEKILEVPGSVTATQQVTRFLLYLKMTDMKLRASILIFEDFLFLKHLLKTSEYIAAVAAAARRGRAAAVIARLHLTAAGEQATSWLIVCCCHRWI